MASSTSLLMLLNLDLLMDMSRLVSMVMLYNRIQSLIDVFLWFLDPGSMSGAFAQSSARVFSLPRIREAVSVCGPGFTSTPALIRSVFAHAWGVHVEMIESVVVTRRAAVWSFHSPFTGLLRVMYSTLLWLG